MLRSKLLMWLTRNRPRYDIDLDNGRYLERYYVGQLWGATFYLHRFVSSDTERHLHNHPWGWGRALVLCGGYVEEYATDFCPFADKTGMIVGRRFIKHWNRIDGSHCHRISNARPNTWTLFMHGARVQVDGRNKGWGFLESAADGHTIFRRISSLGRAWWDDAPRGRNKGGVL